MYNGDEPETYIDNGEGVKENHGTRSEGCARPLLGMVVAGLFLDNVRGYTWSGSYVAGDRGGVLSREDLGRFVRISYSELPVATGTRLFDGLGSVMVYFDCKANGPYQICSDWVEWRPPSGFYRRHSVAEAVNVFRVKVLPYSFGLIARATGVIGAPVDRLRVASHGLARNVYLALRPNTSNSNSSCRAPSIEVNGDGSFSVCFKCPPVLYRRLVNSARVAGRDWNGIIVEVLSGVLP